jgi:hypothetical protein
LALLALTVAGCEKDETAERKEGGAKTKPTVVEDSPEGNRARAAAYVAMMGRGETIPSQDRAFIEAERSRWASLKARGVDDVAKKNEAELSAYISKMEKGQTTPVQDREYIKTLKAKWDRL